ncbi:hypothetical protein QVD17_36594 [Tagetes erecta]|uniref:Uncharacterized protein n=1 Tax=Tagetes erecta TaxID=13708 RepID=A0AAD8JUX8_TARER|nr:hypothetical protein QVD17_36594 [Tagetes erecta]
MAFIFFVSSHLLLLIKRACIKLCCVIRLLYFCVVLSMMFSKLVEGYQLYPKFSLSLSLSLSLSHFFSIAIQIRFQYLVVTDPLLSACTNKPHVTRSLFSTFARSYMVFWMMMTCN